MECAGHVMSHSPNIRICECAASSRLRRLSSLFSSGICPLASKVMSYIFYAASDDTCVPGLNRFDEDKSTMLKTYRDLLTIHLGWVELPLAAFRSGDIGVAPSCGEEHCAPDTTRIY